MTTGPGMTDRLGQRQGFWAALLLAWAALLWWLSARSLPPLGPSFEHADKIKHLLYFAAGGFCAARLLQLQFPAWSAARLLLAGVVFGLLLGGIDEFHQSFTPGRSGNDPGDLAADTAGGLLGAWLALRTALRR